MKHPLITAKHTPIRQVQHKGDMYYSIVDIIENLTGTLAPHTYWAMVKRRNIQLVNVIEQLNMVATDGNIYRTDAANKKGILRILMSVPSPNAEPFKTWLVGVGKQAMDVKDNPELGFDHLPAIKKSKNYGDVPATKSLQSHPFPTSLTDEWQQRGVEKGIEYALLSATITQWTFGLTLIEHKTLKGLAQQNLHDHMTSLELIFTALGEEVTRQIVINDDAQGFIENFGAAQKGGQLAGNARLIFEKKAGMKVASSHNFLALDRDAPLGELS